MSHILVPAAVLVLWSLLVLLWAAVTRFAAFGRQGVKLDGPDARGKRGQDLEGMLPPEVMWKSHNFTHLMEQPTVFYPVVVILALTGAGAADVWLAWAYVGLRIAHSLWQALVNTIPVRFLLFTVSTLCLLALSVRALLAALNAAPGVVS